MCRKQSTIFWPGVGTPRTPTPLSCLVSALASVAERLPPSPRNPKALGSNPGADLFFFFCYCPHYPSFIALSTARAAARGSNMGPPRPGRTLVRSPAAARAVDNALTPYHTNVWL